LKRSLKQRQKPTNETVLLASSPSMKNRLSPSVVVKQMEGQPLDDLVLWRFALANAHPIPLLQQFPGGDPDAKPSGIVKVGWSGTSIHLLAELDDNHIFTRATRFNELLHRLGDTFEIFLQRSGESRYLEFHIAPNNITLQLIYPSGAEFSEYRHAADEVFISRFAIKEPVFSSHVWIAPEKQQWSLSASIDLRLLAPALCNLEEEKWRFNFGRYDYPRDGNMPTLSCSSTLRRLDFHSLKDWGTLRFKT
jgi:hypothetical protein